MNPFTRFLRSRYRGTPDVDSFIRHWDTIEAIVIDVHKRGSVTAAERVAYGIARDWMASHYAVWAPRFAVHWPQTREAGVAAPADPFPRIFAAATADAFAAKSAWSYLQALASARETLNRYVQSNP